MSIACNHPPFYYASFKAGGDYERSSGTSVDGLRATADSACVDPSLAEFTVSDGEDWCIPSAGEAQPASDRVACRGSSGIYHQRGKVGLTLTSQNRRVCELLFANSRAPKSELIQPGTLPRCQRRSHAK